VTRGKENGGADWEEAGSLLEGGMHASIKKSQGRDKLQGRRNTFDDLGTRGEDLPLYVSTLRLCRTRWLDLATDALRRRRQKPSRL